MAGNSEKPQGENTKANAFEQVAAGVYRRVVPETVWLALQHAVSDELFFKNPTIMILFIRIAEVYESIREDLTAREDAGNAQERSAIQLILNPPDELRAAKYLPDEIASPGEMDLCWGEFLVTGQTDSVRKVVEVLDRADRAREFIEAQLESSAEDSLQLNDDERSAIAQAGITLGLETDDGPDVILSDGDVDILLWFAVKNGCAASAKVFQAMPEDTMLHVANKGAAIWSLQANAQQHGAIRLLCEEEASRTGGFGRQLIRP